MYGIASLRCQNHCGFSRTGHNRCLGNFGVVVRLQKRVKKTSKRKRKHAIHCKQTMSASTTKISISVYDNNTGNDGNQNNNNDTNKS